MYEYILHAQKIIWKQFHVLVDIEDIHPIKKGMTNVSFIFKIEGKSYILRLNGTGSERLVNRKNEVETYRLIQPFDIGEKVIAIDSEQGYKLACFIENSRVCDPHNEKDVQMCIGALRNFHRLKLICKYKFDIFDLLQKYESLWKQRQELSCYSDYPETKSAVLQLESFLKDGEKRQCLSHIDAVHDNFLIQSDSKVYLLDWEYAAMCNPIVDLAMFSIYAGYSKYQTDRLIDIYYPEGCGYETRLRVYGYMAAGGLLWSNWCEYKASLGVRFGSYAKQQYEYAKNFSKDTLSLLK